MTFDKNFLNLQHFFKEHFLISDNNRNIEVVLFLTFCISSYHIIFSSLSLLSQNVLLWFRTVSFSSFFPLWNISITILSGLFFILFLVQKKFFNVGIHTFVFVPWFIYNVFFFSVFFFLLYLFTVVALLIRRFSCSEKSFNFNLVLIFKDLLPLLIELVLFY